MMETESVHVRLSASDREALRVEATTKQTTIAGIARLAISEHWARSTPERAVPAPGTVAISHPDGPAPDPGGVEPAAAPPENGPPHRGRLAAALVRFDRLWAGTAAGPGPSEPRARDGEGAGGEAGCGTGRQRR